MLFDTHCVIAASLIPATNRTRLDTHVKCVRRSCSWGNQSVCDTQVTCVPSLFLEPTSSCSLPMFRALAPLVFSANHELNDTQTGLVCAVFLSR